jgi:hypothetical protein
MTTVTKIEASRKDSVTDTRNFSEEISPSRNAAGDADKDKRPPASCCAWCRTEFMADQTRFPIIIEWFGDYFPSGFRMRAIIASLCLDCFKRAHDTEGSDSGVREPRITTVCAGCGEPMKTIKNARHRYWSFCSDRCYQRDYRKRRRGQDSVVQWKGGRPHTYCSVCKKSLNKYGEQHKRKDAVYCSGKCRQWAYRRRRSRP